ncbi:hypothetical protein BSR29_00210 [Boudabousia liubingyangii]|uniref:Uncharacterized protein n=1 Tax=Boudabousia liubingyangii TaxID=1921764 RepID=A0A1Q5PQZ3_9ACTO|nr:hypothetical protein BSR28_02270 [Boudabousia liubingyangii]OKL49855.1 hypothetical protein BSR29_00210 [Boudabousia liubingyangii]
MVKSAEKAAKQTAQQAKQLDTEALTENVSALASQFASKATELASQTRDWAAPRAEQAWKETVKVAAPKIEAASKAVKPKVDAAHEKLVSDYLPRVQKAMADAAAAAQTDAPLRERASDVAAAAQKALSEPVKKGHPVLKGLGLSLLAGLVGAAGYVLWRRSQPVEDPWAEEYWADLEAKTENVDFAAAAEKAEEAAEEAVANMELDDPKEAVKDAAEAVEDKVEDAKEAVKDAVEK